MSTSAQPENPVCLSIRQPWAYLIFHAGKDVENRTWFTGLRGPVRIHAATGGTLKDYNAAVVWVRRFITSESELFIPQFDEFLRGGIIGQVDIVGCVKHSPSPWFEGPWGFVLQGATALPFEPCRGALGFFRP